MKAIATPLLMLLTLTPGALSQAPMDDALWIASRYGRSLTKVDRCGEVLQSIDLNSNGFDLRSVNRAPDGKLWVVNYITTTLTILDRDGANLRNIATSGTPYAIAFDRSGDAFITMSGSSAVERFDPSGTPLGSFAVPSSPLGIAVDNRGMVWVAHRSGPPGTVSRIDPRSGNVASFTLAATSAMLPVHITTDQPAGGGPSQIWVTGDRSNELVKMDSTGAVLNTFNIGSSSSGLAGLAVGREGNIWVSNYRNGEVNKIRASDGMPLLTFWDLTSSAMDLAMDSMGNPWIVNRTPTPAELRRFGFSSGVFEVAAPVGSGAYQAPDAAGFHHAFVVDPTGDADGDGEMNLAEIAGGTSPYDAQSTSQASLNTLGTTALGGALDLIVSGSSPGPLALMLAGGINAGTPLGSLGTLYLDPLMLFPVAPLLLGVPSASNVPIARDPALLGTIWMQGFYLAGGPALANKAGLLIYN